MKAYVLEGINQLEYKEVDTPQIREDEVLVEVMAAGICGSDIPRIFTTGTYHFPTIPGHEFAGRVVQSGSDSNKHWVGKRVGVFPLIPCKECDCCKNAQYEMCENYNYLGSRCDGGFAEYVAVPEWNLIELPEAVSYAEAALLEPASVALHAVRRLELGGVETVLLQGLGTIGIIIAQWLRIHGVQTVIATGHNINHGKSMKKLADASYIYLDACDEADVTEQVMKLTDGKGVDAVFDCVATSASLTDALACVKPAGQIVVVGNPKGDIAIDKNSYWKILRKQIRINGTWNSSFTHEDDDDWNNVLKACEIGELHLAELITHRLSFDRLEDGLAIMRDRLEYRNKIMIVKE